MPEIECGNCGHRNPAGANFCSSCGRELRAAVDATTGAIPIDDLISVDDGFEADRAEFPLGSALLVVHRGPKAGSRYALDAPMITAGRHPDSDIFLDDVTVSRRHAELRADNGRYLVRDAGSLNGTYVNRRRIDEIELEDGDELQIGMFKLVFLRGTKA